jgi:signal transduction histidine kinase
MSREIHDTLLQDLVGVSLHFDELAATTGSALGPATDKVIRLRRYLERAIEEARHAVWDLRSAHNEDTGLPTALRENGERAFQSKAAHFGFTLTGTVRPCPPAVGRHLLRIAREALYNAARHADATHVHLSLEYGSTHIVLRVSDDGRGCRVAATDGESSGHYGFQIMRERAEQAGGRFHLESSPGHGTRIAVTVPTSPDAQAPDDAGR